MTFKLITNDNTTPQEPTPPPFDGLTYRIVYSTTFEVEGGDLVEERKIKGWPTMFGPFFAITSSHEGFVLPVLCIPSEDVLLIEVVES